MDYVTHLFIPLHKQRALPRDRLSSRASTGARRAAGKTKPASTADKWSANPTGG